MPSLSLKDAVRSAVKITRSRREFNLVGGSALVATLASTRVRSWAQEMPSFNVGHFSSANPQTYAKASGSLVTDLHGKATVNFLAMSSAPQFLAAMAGGSIDTCAIASSSIVTAFAEKLDVSLVYIEKVITTSEALIVRKAAGIAKLVDLKGRKIGTPFNTSAHFALLCILAKARLRAADVQIINMRPESLFATWSRAEIDAAYIWHPFQGQLVNAGGQILITTADLTDMGLSLFDGILVRNDFKRRCPEILLAYLKNYARTCETFRGQQAVVVQTLSAYLGVPNDVIRQYVSTFATLTPAEILSVQWMGPVAAHGTGVLRSLSAQADFLVAANQIEAAPKDLERFIDSSIAARIA